MAKPAKDKNADAKATTPTVHKPAEIPPMRPGDLVTVQVRIKEGDKERLQAFQGTVISIRGAGDNRSFTVRKVSRGYGIERIFPFATPVIAGVEIKRHSKVRRARLYYLRDKTGRSAALKERKVEGKHRPGAVEE
jgi:large subunit ribosomal protein L19